MFKCLGALLAICTLSTAALASEWCPRYQGSLPAAVVDVGEYKSFYFVSGSIYNEMPQTAVVYVTKNNQILSKSSAEGISDWFNSTEYDGPENGFNCDSQSLDFYSAWLIDENGRRKKFRSGEVRAPNFENHKLVCSDQLAR